MSQEKGCQICGGDSEGQIITAIEVPGPIHDQIAQLIRVNCSIDMDVWSFMRSKPVIVFNGCVVIPKSL